MFDNILQCGRTSTSLGGVSLNRPRILHSAIGALCRALPTGTNQPAARYGTNTCAQRQAEMLASWERETNAGPHPDTGLYGKDAREFREFLGTVGDFLSTLRDAIVIWRARGGPRH